MKIPLSWLKEFIHIALSPSEIGKLLTMSGIEVDSIHTLPLPFHGVVVGKILEVKKHPDAEKLVVTTVTDGLEYFQVVCGASNCRKGLKTAFAKIGATITLPDGHVLKIKKSKLRGVESVGMLCSGKELGLTEDDNGIIEFPEKYPEGKDLLDIYSDAILEISLTPNLNHCASVLGVARELSALTAHPLHFPNFHSYTDDGKNPKQFSVVVEDAENCPRYACRLIQGVHVAPSPTWLQQRLLTAGLRPVNNIVDATNYVLLELGQPLHAFDFDKLNGKKIIVKRAQAGQTLLTLDHVERTLDENTLVISDGKEPVAIAGVVGGLLTEITESTCNVLIESAYFKPSSIRKTSKQQGIMTEASKRFERGADPQQVLPSLERVCALILEIAGGTISDELVDIKQALFTPKTISCRLSRINHLLGTQLALSEVETIFQRLQCLVTHEGHNALLVKVPSYRGDLNIEIDLVEEVARIYGYNHIPKSFARHQSSPLPHAPIYLFERDVRTRLVSAGLQEFLTCDLINPALIEKTVSEHIPTETVVKILNPNSVDQSILRPTLLPGLLEVVKHNLDHRNENISGFEVGRIHYKDNDHYKEQSTIGIILTGHATPLHWEKKPQEIDFFDLKGIIENLLTALTSSHLLFKLSLFKNFHPGRQADVYIEHLKVGSLGEIHPSVLRAWDISSRVFYAELNLHELFHVRKPDPLMQDLPQYPSSDRDWTVTLPQKLPIEEVLHAIISIPSHLLDKKRIQLLWIHQSEKLGHHLKNATFRLIYRDLNRTLAFEEVTQEHLRITEGVLTKLYNEGKISNIENDSKIGVKK